MQGRKVLGSLGVKGSAPGGEADDSGDMWDQLECGNSQEAQAADLVFNGRY